jgi:hypothetical protein
MSRIFSNEETEVSNLPACTPCRQKYECSMRRFAWLGILGIVGACVIVLLHTGSVASMIIAGSGTTFLLSLFLIPLNYFVYGRKVNRLLSAFAKATSVSTMTIDEGKVSQSELEMVDNHSILAPLNQGRCIICNASSTTKCASYRLTKVVAPGNLSFAGSNSSVILLGQQTAHLCFACLKRICKRRIMRASVWATLSFVVGATSYVYIHVSTNAGTLAVVAFVLGAASFFAAPVTFLVLLTRIVRLMLFTRLSWSSWILDEVERRFYPMSRKDLHHLRQGTTRMVR